MSNIVVKTDGSQSADDLAALVKKTNKANPTDEDMAALSKYFDAEPWAWRQIGNLRYMVERNVIAKASQNSAIAEEATRRFLKHLRDELGYETSTFVEKMLIQEITMCWLRLQLLQNEHLSATNGQHRMEVGAYYEKRLHLTQKRYMNALETLAKVRKLIAQTQAKGAKMFKDLVKAKGEEKV